MNGARRLSMPYIPIFVVRMSSGANTFLISYLASGGNIIVGFILASYPFVEALSSFAAGHMTDILGRRITFIVGYSWILIFMLLLYVMLSLINNPTWVALINGLMGFGAALVLVSTLTMITDLTERGHRGIGMGVFDFLNIFGYALGYLVGSVLYQLTTAINPAYADYSFLILLTILVVIYAAIVKYIPETKGSIGSKIYLNPFRGLSRDAWAPLPIWFAITTILGVAIYAGRALRTIPGILPIHVGFLLLGATIVIGLGSVVFGHLSDKIGRVRIMSIGIVGVSIGLAILTVLLILGINPLIAVAVASPFIFMASAVVPSILALTGDKSIISMRGSSMGLYSLVLGFGMGAGSILSSYAFSALGLGGIALAALLIYITALVLFSIIKFLTK
ncbi:MAG: MFS transporter [Vulcanisaeta sp. AZ3]|jgi:MFS family permease|nr:MAG: MFS transporter [Vulcanisaeta sp. AZ3]